MLPSASSQFSVSLGLTIPSALPSRVARASRIPCVPIGLNTDHGKNMKYILKQPTYTRCPLERSKYLLIASSATCPTPGSGHLTSLQSLSGWLLCLLQLPTSSEGQLYFEQFLANWFSACVFCHSLPRLSPAPPYIYIAYLEQCIG